MLLNNYFKNKSKYAHEDSIHKSKVAGTVYTPDVLQHQMVYMLLHSDLKSNAPALVDCFDQIWNAYSIYTWHEKPDIDESPLSPDSEELLKFLLDKTIVDPCAGTGMLLCAYIEFIVYLLIKNSQIHLLTGFIRNNIFAIDIESKGLNALYDVLEALFHDLNVRYEGFSSYCDNSLLMKLPPFDLLISNPPYIGEKGHTEIFEPIKLTDLGKKYYEGKMDYFYFFIFKGKDMVKPNGTLCFLTSNYFFNADGASKLRSFLKHEMYIHSMMNFEHSNLFKGRNLHTCLYTLSKIPCDFVEVYTSKFENDIRLIPYTDIFSDKGNFQFISNMETQGILEKMKAHALNDLCVFYDVKQGIVSGADRSDKNVNGLKEPVFVFQNDEISKLDVKLKEILKPFYKNSQIERYSISEGAKYFILYIDEHVTPEIKKLLIEHLEPFKAKLNKRREVQNGVREWYMLTWPREKSIFDNEKIVVPQRNLKNIFAYTREAFYASADVYFIQKTQNSPYSLKATTLYLNSKFIYFWLYFQGKRKGSLLELYSTPLKNIPIFNLPVNEVETLALKFYSKDITKQEQNDILVAFDTLIYDRLQLSETEFKYLEEFSNENYY